MRATGHLNLCFTKTLYLGFGSFLLKWAPLSLSWKISVLGVSYFGQNFSTGSYSPISYKPDWVYQAAWSWKTGEGVWELTWLIPFSEVLYNTVYFDTKKYVFHFPQSSDEDMSYPFNCQLCIRRFAKKDKFEQHLRRHINSQKMEDAFACLFCNNATFPTCQVCSLTQFLFFRFF